MSQNIANLCVKCETRFTEWADYHAHVTENKCRAPIKPLNTSGRKTGVYMAGQSAAPAGTIVGDAERTWLKAHLIKQGDNHEVTMEDQFVAGFSGLVRSFAAR